jgi:hypothetical protein
MAQKRASRYWFLPPFLSFGQLRLLMTGKFAAVVYNPACSRATAGRFHNRIPLPLSVYQDSWPVQIL